MQKRECSLCANYDKDIRDDPCFSCSEHTFRKNFEPIQQSKSKLADDIRHKLVIYKLLNRQLQNCKVEDDIACISGGVKTNGWLNVINECDKASDDVSKLIFDAVISGDILLYTKGANNGKPTAI